MKTEQMIAALASVFVLLGIFLLVILTIIPDDSKLYLISINQKDLFNSSVPALFRIYIFTLDLMEMYLVGLMVFLLIKPLRGEVHH